MPSLIAMAVYCTEENKKDDCLLKTLKSLESTVDWNNNRLILSVNAATERTKEIIDIFSRGDGITKVISEVIWNEANIGTAEAINLAWRQRRPDEHAIKIDDDVIIKQEGWIEDMEEAIRRDNKIGQVGLKRKDCWEKPEHENEFYRSYLTMLPKSPSERWIVIEEAHHIMGTCVMHSANLLNKVGYLYQPGVYGFDDSLMSLRSELAGFYNCFLPHIEIDHIDDGKTPFQQWKEKKAGEKWDDYHKVVAGYKSGKISLYYNPYESKADSNK